MSCCCTHIDYWNPCRCGAARIVTTSTTTTTTTCADGEPCDEALDLNCIIYCGPDIPCWGVKQGDSAADILQVVYSYVCPQSFTTTTTTTQPPVIVPICLKYAPTGGCAAACAAIPCTQYYMLSTCAQAIYDNIPINILGCKIYTDPAGTIPAPDGWYSKQGGSCLIAASSFNSGEITGVTNCV
jgi:hypothetical protein